MRLLLGLALVLAATSAYSAPKNLLVLGDSLSAEYGLQRGSGWTTLLQQRLQQDKSGFQVVNASISGDTTIGGRNRLPALMTQHKPAVLVIELGANDALRGLPLKTSQDNLQAMIDLAREQKAKVLLVGMQIPPNYGPDYTRRFAAMYQDLAKANKLALVPFFFEGIAADLSQFQADRIHPNEQAQPRLLDNVWPYLKPLLGLK
ncbi:arylesterase [Herbaspirillum rubrisubalbicans]|uniref:Arylesterase n=2 Tax=Herbaspirillum rubrisubalbicans TaxID=80842 RepID=A0ABX9C7B9_9BURK|nr:arylesterase [Herbaspirillum rubrisubalbicans]NQE51091.1 arylesterase [Herbaspirillum rubrisubalbicans]QJQ00919.1 arylesterase [Herbaspirillum rubrisubalbicans Os34]RAM66417.1 arylesterase [Herbaspirillum rubrisubalbicans]RAN49411.1 arylesterase [Herbaspirillum rubrisubalbicans]